MYRMSKFTNYIIEEAKTWATQYETDFRRTTLKEYLKNNNLTKRAHIIIVKEDIRENKQGIKKLYEKDANRKAQKIFGEKNKKNTLLVASQ